MNSLKVAAILLILAGVFGLVYGSFSFTQETHTANLGSVELSVNDKKTVNIPIWAGVGTIMLGSVLLLLGSKQS